MSWFVAVTGLLLLVVHVQSKIETISLENDDRQSIPFSQPFGFASGSSSGHIAITLHNITASSHSKNASINWSKIFFYLENGTTEADLDESTRSNLCAASSEAAILVLFSDIDIQTLVKKETSNVTILRGISGGGCLFALRFANCAPPRQSGGSSVSLTFKAKVAMYNVDPVTNHKYFVSVGLRDMDTMYWVRSLWAPHTPCTCHSVPKLGHRICLFGGIHSMIVAVFKSH
jgi:hypothetical protein